MSTTIETITVTRPMKVIAFTLCTITVFLLIATVSASDWVNSGGWREGLFATCVERGTPTPLPFGEQGITGCFRGRSAGYIRGTAALLVIALLTDFFGTLLTGLGLRSTDPNKKYKYYRVAIYSLLAAVITLFLAVIIYPVSFSKDLAAEGPKGPNNPVLDGFEVTTLKSQGSTDFDGDGILDIHDTDDDGDGVPDTLDMDDDNDGIPDAEDDDDDNDGIPDAQDQDLNLEDSDGDGTPDSEDLDDDNDGVPDSIDVDDDNDGIVDELEDSDGDGTPDSEDLDDDNDGVPDSVDDDDDNDGIVDEEVVDKKDTDNDGITDDKDTDIDNDGIPNSQDKDDDGDGTEDEEDFRAGDIREFSWGFGYGCSWACLIFIFISVVLLICDRESEEIFYKERPVEEEGEEEEA